MMRQFELVERVKAYDPTADEDLLNRAYVFAMKENSKHYHFYATAPKVYTLERGPAKDQTYIKKLLSDYVVEFEKILKMSFKFSIKFIQHLFEINHITLIMHFIML